MGYFSLSGPEWKTVSKDAKILLKKMLTYNSKERISAEKCLKSTWIQVTTKNDVVLPNDAR